MQYYHHLQKKTEEEHFEQVQRLLNAENEQNRSQTLIAHMCMADPCAVTERCECPCPPMVALAALAYTGAQLGSTA